MLSLETPTLDDMFEKWRENIQYLPSLVNYFQLVASGNAPPELHDSNATFAAQTVLILINHFLKLEEHNAAAKTTTS